LLGYTVKNKAKRPSRWPYRRNRK